MQEFPEEFNANHQKIILIRYNIKQFHYYHKHTAATHLLLTFKHPSYSRLNVIQGTICILAHPFSAPC